MGSYFNPGNEAFRRIINDEIYIDKSGLLNFLNKKICVDRNCISVSHARRFGKSQAASMIEAYYSKGCDSKDLFSGLEVSDSAEFEKHRNKYNLIHFDVSSFTDFYKETLVSEIIRYISDEIKAEYPNLDYSKNIASVLCQVYEKSGKIPFVIVIDEWDCVIRNFSDSPETVHEYMHFLHSLFKSKEAKTFLGLGYITGILPIKKIEDESALNNFNEYTMTESYEIARYFGFTEKEAKTLCEEYNMDYDSLREWYDGYILGEDTDNKPVHMYNPNSVYSAMIHHKYSSYWKNTSAFETINTYINLNFDGLKEDVIQMLNGGRVSVDTESFKNDFSEINSKDDALTALIHLGYLGYDSSAGEAYVPNYEVARAYHSAMKTSEWKEISRLFTLCNDTLKYTLNRDCEKVAELVELSHETYSSVLKYNDENALSCAITMAYFTAPAFYNIVREFPSGKGFADLVFIPRADSKGKPAMVIELKWDKSADTAINQIKENRYAGLLKGYSSEILLVGINYDKESKKHECKIETYIDLNHEFMKK